MPRLPSLLPLSLLMLLLAPACRFEGAKADLAENAVRSEAPVPARGTYVLGSSVLPQGAIARDAASDTFQRGTPVFLSVDVSGASKEQAIRIDWLDARGRILREEQRVVPAKARYVAFSTGPTAGWRPGAYRVVVIIEGRRVNEQTFTVA